MIHIFLEINISVQEFLLIYCNLYFIIFRLCFIVTIFFLLFSLIMVNVKSSKDPRSGIQNGFWAIKFLIIIGGMIGSFFIPVGTFGKQRIGNIKISEI